MLVFIIVCILIFTNFYTEAAIIVFTTVVKLKDNCLGDRYAL